MVPVKFLFSLAGGLKMHFVLHIQRLHIFFF